MPRGAGSWGDVLWSTCPRLSPQTPPGTATRAEATHSKGTESRFPVYQQHQVPTLFCCTLSSRTRYFSAVSAVQEGMSGSAASMKKWVGATLLSSNSANRLSPRTHITSVLRSLKGRHRLESLDVRICHIDVAVVNLSDYRPVREVAIHIQRLDGIEARKVGVKTIKQDHHVRGQSAHLSWK